MRSNFFAGKWAGLCQHIPLAGGGRVSMGVMETPPAVSRVTGEERGELVQSLATCTLLDRTVQAGRELGTRLYKQIQYFFWL